MKPHDEWLFKAGNDLESAEYLLTSKKELFDIVVYHAQQCAEKAVEYSKVILDFTRQWIY
jgi:HEPN domain-containing protein